jgi:hypothetical protein
MDLDVRPGHPDLLDQQTYEPLPLLEVEGVDALPSAISEGFDPASQPVVDRELLALGQQRLTFLLELPMPLGHLAMPRLELGELDGLHLVEVNHPSSLALGLLQAPVQASQLSTEQLVVGLAHAGAERGLPLQQDVGLEQCLAEVGPDQRIQLLGSCRGLRAGTVGSARLK